MSHFYDIHGNPYYEVPNKSKPGKMRPTNLGDAKKLAKIKEELLFVGATDIAGIPRSKQIENWSEEQVAMAAVTGAGQMPEESDKDFVKRIIKDAKEQINMAADLGTLIHDELEAGLSGQEVSPQYAPFIGPVLDYVYEEFGTLGCEAEKTFSSKSHGYGGKIDLVIKASYPKPSVVIDFKTTRKLEDKKKSGYVFDKNGMQLAGYCVGYGLPLETTRLINIHMSTTEPGCFKINEWENNHRYWDMFECLLNFWKIKSNYDPSALIGGFNE